MALLAKKIPIFPMPGISLPGQIAIGDHINFTGESPNLGFIPVTDLYAAKENLVSENLTSHKFSENDSIVVVFIKPGLEMGEAEAELLVNNGVAAYTYAPIDEFFHAAANGNKVEAVGFVPTLPLGYKVFAASAGLKETGNSDLGLIYSQSPALWSGTFTQNSARASCVEHNIAAKSNKIQAIVCNSGNANACTGEAGKKADQELRQIVAEKLSIDASAVLSASTGKIGVPLDISKISSALKNIEVKSARDFAEAILTTDTVIKISQHKNILGFAKGSGMIEPNMATMLAFIISDVKLKGLDEKQSQIEFNKALKEIVDQSFNAISVDGDTSTNDMVLFMTNQEGEEISLEEFKATLLEVSQDLAKQIVQDGEGTTKLIELNVTGAEDKNQARTIGKKIINSPLVKTAIFGNDPNWGRIIMALGNAEADFDLEKVSLSILGQEVFAKGLPTDFDRDSLSTLMKMHKTVTIDLVLGSGETSTVWGSDLSYDYVKINAEYFT